MQEVLHNYISVLLPLVVVNNGNVQRFIKYLLLIISRIVIFYDHLFKICYTVRITDFE